MASISSTNSSTSLGNTSLRGFGGMTSGIDRDSIIEQMTLKTTTKINNQKKKITKLEWKQEAYREVSDKILDWTDKYASYSSSSNLKDPSAFAKNQITVHGKDDITGFVTATGSSSMLSNVSIMGVGQLATSTVRRSSGHASDGIQTNLTSLSDELTFSQLNGTNLKFGTWENDPKGGQGQFKVAATITFPSSFTYTENGETKTEKIDYTTNDPEKLVAQLNKWLENSEAKIGNGDNAVALKEAFRFSYDKDNDKLTLDVNGRNGLNGYVIDSNSTALKALGYVAGNEAGFEEDGIDVDEFNAHATNKFTQTAQSHPTALTYLTNQKLTFNYDGSQKSIELITTEERKELEELMKASNSKDSMTIVNAYLSSEKVGDETYMAEVAKRLTQLDDLGIDPTEVTVGKLKSMIAKETDADKKAVLESVRGEVGENSVDEQFIANLQRRLDQAFGTGMVNAEFGADGLKFTTKNDKSTLSIVSNDNDLLTNLGLEYGSSNKINLDGKITQDALLGKDYSGVNVTKEGSNALDLVINGVEITGLTKNSSISDILSKINSTSEAGVKATYVTATGQFMLVSSETGQGREINLDSDLAKALFGQYKDKDGNIDAESLASTDKEVTDKGLTSGQNAKIFVDYGDGVAIELDRASNTFNLEGLNVTVSGVFGGEMAKDADGNVITDENGNVTWENDSSRNITFTAKADVDGAVEKVKSFFEEFNEIVTLVSGHIRTRPDSKYDALTDEQKEEMDETSIENWEKKAKQGILYGDSAMQDLSGAIESIFSKLMQYGAKYDDLKEIGISYSEDYLDGGTLVFDEAKFRDAMETNPEKVSNIFTGGGGVRKGLVDVIDETFTPYATKYASKNGGDSYGRLIDIAGSEKKPITLNTNQIYKQLKEMQEAIDRLQEQLQVEQDRYISQFTTMETLLNKMNTQQSYLAQITG